MNTTTYRDSMVTVYLGDCRAVMADLSDASVHAIVTDPPYETKFMGRQWDASGIAFDPAVWRECLRVLKPGGHLLAFGGSRTSHRLTVAIEDAGFEIRDTISWLYGTGFPKSLDVSKAIDKAAGAERTIIGDKLDRPGYHLHGNTGGQAYGLGISSTTPETRLRTAQITAPATANAKTWQGWGTALKPACEPIIVARKPLSGTVAANVLEHGAGAINVDGCRVETDEDIQSHHGSGNPRTAMHDGWHEPYEKGSGRKYQTSGRWPTNAVLSHASTPDGADLCADGCVPGCPVLELDTQSGIQRDGTAVQRHGGGQRIFNHGNGLIRADQGYGSSGGASRFFPVFRYQAKAPARERPTDSHGIAHPTVKPLALIRWLVRLVTPPDGIVLDPFIGSGTTAEAAKLEEFRCIGIELEPSYSELIRLRLGGKVRRRGIQLQASDITPPDQP